MSLISRGQRRTSPSQAMVDKIKHSIATRDGFGQDSDVAGRMVALESFDSLNESEYARLTSAVSQIETTFSDAMESVKAECNSIVGLEGFQIDPKSGISAGLEAATMLAGLSGDRGAMSNYARAGYSNQITGADDAPLARYETSGPAGSIAGHAKVTAGLEAFDEKQLEEMLPYSIVFNAEAARQDPFSEMFYNTVVVSPELGGIEMRVDRTLVYNATTHPTDGSRADFQYRPLIQAARDYTILADNSLELVPYKRADGSNADAFMSGVEEVREVARVDIQTGPLKAGKTIDLLGISTHPTLQNNHLLDHTDAIDSRVTLRRLYYRNGSELVKFDVTRLQRNGFIKSREGDYREMTLNFRNEAAAFTPDTKTFNGADPAFLQLVRDNDVTVHLEMRANGDLNVNDGSVNVNGSALAVTRIVQSDGTRMGMSEGVGKQIVDAIGDMPLVGYDLIAGRTNSNRRTEGLLMTHNLKRERYAIPFSSPLTAPSPLGQNREASDLESLITGARFRNSNNAVTTLLNYAETLRTYVATRPMDLVEGVADVEGIGRYAVQPFFEETDIDIAQVINSLTTKERAEDIQAVLVNAIRDVAFRMHRDSAYQIGLNASNVGSKEAKLIVGTDPNIIRHLQVAGDPRTFGAAFGENFQIEETWDNRMRGKIVVSLTRTGSEGTVDGLKFGTFAWMPELISTVQVSRNNATYMQPMVQPRALHINNLPIMAVINVKGLEDALTKNIGLNTRSSTDSTRETDDGTTRETDTGDTVTTS